MGRIQNYSIIGGGMVGCELALWLRKDCKKNVTVVEGLDKLLAVNVPLCSVLERLVPFVGCDVYVKTTAARVTETGVLTPVEKHALCLPAQKAASSTRLLAGKTLYFFIVLLTGSGSECSCPCLFCSFFSSRPVSRCNNACCNSWPPWSCYRKG